MNDSTLQRRGLEPYRVLGDTTRLRRWIADVQGETPELVETASMHRYLGLAYLAIGDDPRARLQLEYSSDEVAPIHLVLLDSHEKKWDEAASRFRLIGSAHAAAPVFAAKGSVEAFEYQAYERALPYLELAVRLDTQGYQALLVRGRILRALGEYKRALADFALVLERCPSCWEPYSYRAEIHGATGASTFEQIERDIRDALRLAPGNGFVEAQLAFWLRDHSRDAEATQQFWRVIKTSPGFLDPYLALADLYRRQGDSSQALEVLALALRHCQDHQQRGKILRLVDVIQHPK